MADPQLDALLQHSRWVRKLAQSLARDPGLVEDIVQETWLSALRRGPRDDRSLRGWLATLLRRHLLHCLEHHYGDLSTAVAQTDDATRLLRTIAELTAKYR